MRFAARRDGNEPALIQTAQALGALWIQGPPFDGWLWFRDSWYLIEIKQAHREGHKHEYTEAQLKTIMRLNDRRIPWYTLRTESDVFALLNARRSA